MFPLVPLSQLCEIDRIHARPDDRVMQKLPFVGVENVDPGSGILNFDSNSRVGNRKSAAFRFDTRHVLYGKLRPYLNKVATPEFSGTCSTELIPLLPRDEVDREFLAHLLRRKQTIDFVMASVTGSRMPRTDMKVLMSMKVPLPSIHEQRRIVGILNRAARIERLRVHANERLREFVPALLIEMFGDPIDNPMGWPVSTLGEVSLLGPQYGANSRSVPFEKHHPRYIRISDINMDGSLADDQVGVDLKDYERYRLQEHDLLFARSGSVGKSYIHDAKNGLCVFAGYLIRFRLDKSRVLPEFVFAYTQTPAYRNWIAVKQRTATQPNINGPEYASLKVLVPPIETQLRFTRLIEAQRATGALIRVSESVIDQFSKSLLFHLIGEST